jgi:type IV secretion system protein VirB4
MAVGAHFESEYFLTLTYLPPAEVEERAKGWLFEGRGAYDSSKTAAQHLERFRTKVDMFENIFSTLFQTERLKRVTVTDDLGGEHVHDALLRYLRRTVSGLDHTFALPEFPCYLNEVLACEDLYGGMEPRIGSKHIRVIAVDGFPRMSSPGILRELDQLPIDTAGTHEQSSSIRRKRAHCSIRTGRSGARRSVAGRTRFCDAHRAG